MVEVQLICFSQIKLLMQENPIHSWCLNLQHMAEAGEAIQMILEMKQSLHGLGTCQSANVPFEA